MDASAILSSRREGDPHLTASELSVDTLRCEFTSEPLGIDTPAPRLSWQIVSTRRDVLQTACQIEVASSLDLLQAGRADLWDSGRLETSVSSQIEYSGARLESFQRCWWRVRVWDNTGGSSPWSAPSWWEMAIVDPGQWQAGWISAPAHIRTAPLLRRAFSIPGAVRSARAYICGLGCYELSLNGQRIGESVLDPAQTDYDRRAFYATYDIIAALRPGKNAAGVMLGNGWYNQERAWGHLSYGRPALICMMRIETDNGEILIVGTDPAWRASSGPVVSNNLYAGETYDARLEVAGWSDPEFDDSGWGPVEEAQSHAGELQAQPLPPVRAMKIIRPVSILSPEARVYVYDMGQNFTGWVRLRTEAPESTAVTLRFSEAVDADGRLQPGSTGVRQTGAVQTDTYICKGDGLEVYEPRFTCHGFRYVELTRYAGEATLDDIEGVVVHTAVDKAGAFECSDLEVNRVHQAAIWTQLSNLQGIPTTCPHRDRWAALGDARASAEATIFNFDTASFWEKYLDDIETSLTSDGLPSPVAPGKRSGSVASPQAGSAIVQIPWYLYLYYGDKRPLTKHYESMKRWTNHLEGLAMEGLNANVSAGRSASGSSEDCWSSGILAAGFFYLSASVLARIASVLGKPGDSEALSSRATKAQEAFNQRFLRPDERGLRSYPTAAANVFALWLGLPPEDCRSELATALARQMEAGEPGSPANGACGEYLYQVLGAYGRADQAVRLLSRPGFPGFGHLFEMGATTLWEAPDDPKEVEPSRNHLAQTAVDAWLYSGLCGINPSADAPGFAKVRVQPQITSSLSYASAIYKSIRGPIESGWDLDGRHLTYTLTLPPNTSAEIYLPVDMTRVKESGRKLDEATRPTLSADSSGRPVILAGSGSYQFSGTLV